MKKILLVLCGGTICTSTTEIKGSIYRSISDNAISLLSQNFYKSNSKFINDVTFTISENFGILSENMTVDKWNTLIHYFKRVSMSFKDYAGIIVAHGTDTLAYSSALFSLILRNIDIPVFFVSSNEPLTSPKSNGNINFQKAVECICMRIKPNVYVIYKNPSSGKIYLHLGSRLTQCSNYSEDFYSKGCIDITNLSNAVECNHLFDNIETNNSEVLTLTTCPDLYNCVLKIDPYIGLDYRAFDYTKFKAVLHGTYHSGTVCAEKTQINTYYGTQSFLFLIDECTGKTDLYLAPAKKNGEIYDSIGIIDNHKPNEIHFLYGCTNEMTYIKLLLAYAIRVDDVEVFMKTDFNGEIVYS